MLPTRDHDVIRHWAEANDATPAEIIPLKFDSEPTILYFLFGEARAGTPELRPITWEDFFAKFDLLGLSIAFDQQSCNFDIVRVEKSSQQSTSH